ncbi:MAG: cadherin-like beta sandwich domain-containing protein, partial [Caldilinea sp.]|nr:cadherin-like beta sandwich domain-containing protein [Caldilinea sp.]
QLVNGVLWGNSAGGFAPGNQIANYGGTTVLSNTLIQSDTNDIWVGGGSVTFGPGIITSDPIFVAPIAATDAPTTTGNYRLQAGSPAIDSGDNSAVAVSTDLDGNARIQGGVVDMGAYEFNLPDVALSKTVFPTSAKPGYAITYTLAFSNSGAATATNVIVTDSVPVSVTNPSVAGSSGAVIIPTGTAPNFAWQIADLAPGEGGIITLTGVLSNPLAAGIFANTAEITATGDGDAANNRSSAAISVSDFDARLANLVLSSGPLTPAFISTTTSYTAVVANLTTSVTVTPTTSDANATLAVNGAPLGSGEAYTLTPLVVGPNVVSTTVTAEDGVTQQSYAITVTRLGADGDWYVEPVGDDANNCRAPGVGYACRTIIGAMNKAASGDRIFIAPATYTESLVVTKSLTYIGVGGADVTLVSGGGSSR